MQFMKLYSSGAATCKSITFKSYFQNGNHFFVNQEIHTFLWQDILENTNHLNSHPPAPRVPTDRRTF